MKIRIWIRDAAEQLASAGITSALLDAEIILAHTLRKSRTWLHAHGDDELGDREREIAGARLDLRLDRTPIAYIIGHKEFYGRLFKVTPAVLIPRPESEAAIDLLVKYKASGGRLLDVGTGSGAIGISAKLEFPDLSVTLSDVSRHALTIAEENAKLLKADVTLLRSDLLSDIPGLFNYIVANLPYVDKSWERSPETNHEPELALFAERNGLALIYRLITQSVSKLMSDGLLLLEADPRQHAAIIDYASARGFTHRETDGFIVTLQVNATTADMPPTLP